MEINVFIIITPLFLFIPQGIRRIGQAGNVDERISFLLFDVSQGYLYVFFKHHSSS